MEFYDSAPEAEEEASLLLMENGSLTDDEAWSIVRSCWPGVVIGYWVLMDAERQLRRPFPNQEMIRRLRARFGLTLENLLDAADAGLRIVEEYGGSQRKTPAVLDEMCRELVVVQGHSPCALADGLLLCMWVARRRDNNVNAYLGDLTEWLSGWNGKPERMPDYLGWDYQRTPR